MQELRAEVRTTLGKQVKTARDAGVLPAVVYGEGVPSQPISVSYRDFEKVYKEAGESTLLRLVIGASGHTVLIHDVMYDPLRGQPIHADFYAVRMDKMLRVAVPIVFVGDAPAVKNEGGILIKVMHEVTVEALPTDLPHEFRVDVSSLASLGSRISVRDLSHDRSVRLMADSHDTVALIEAPRSEEELATLGEAPPVEIKQVETEREAKTKEKVKETAIEEETK